MTPEEHQFSYHLQQMNKAIKAGQIASEALDRAEARFSKHYKIVTFHKELWMAHCEKTGLSERFNWGDCMC